MPIKICFWANKRCLCKACGNASKCFYVDNCEICRLSIKKSGQAVPTVKCDRYQGGVP
jgi:hypothetical protein